MNCQEGQIFLNGGTMETHFDEALLELKQKLLGMASRTEEMIGLAVESLVKRKLDLADKVLEIEASVNQYEVEIESEVLRLLARWQPAAKDLRFLTGVMRITVDLERVGDQACNISETVKYLLEEPPLKPLIDIPKMAELTQIMIKNSLDAFVNHDTVLAKIVCERDDQVDDLNEQMFRELLTYMMESPKNIKRAVDLILISRNLERIADQATNIAEEVIFIEEGRNVKHHLTESNHDLGPNH